MREAIGRMRRHVTADLEDDLVPVPQLEASWVDARPHAVAIDADDTAEAREPIARKRPAPDREEIGEGRRPIERDDSGRIGSPGASPAARAHCAAELIANAAQPDAGRDDHDAAVGEELDVYARRADERSGDTRSVRCGRRVVLRPGADRRRHERSGEKQRDHRLHAIPVIALLVLAAGCGGASSEPQGITVQPARAYRLELSPTHAPAGKQVAFSGRIVQPDGTILKHFKRGGGPHTGVHLIFVRRDLSSIVHRHPAVAADGTFREPVTLPEAGAYRVVVDAYPASGPETNFQLFSSVTIAGTYAPRPIPAPQATQTVDGYRFALHGDPHLRAIEPAFLRFTVTAPDGKPASFTPWYGALAHAIFFRKGSLDYFHTHVCARNATGCTSALGGARVTGTSTTPGTLTVGVLVPLPGVWRLFLQCRADGRVVTAPFTLRVS